MVVTIFIVLDYVKSSPYILAKTKLINLLVLILFIVFESFTFIVMVWNILGTGRLPVTRLVCEY